MDLKLALPFIVHVRNAIELAKDNDKLVRREVPKTNQQTGNDECAFYNHSKKKKKRMCIL